MYMYIYIETSRRTERERTGRTPPSEWTAGSADRVVRSPADRARGKRHSAGSAAVEDTGGQWSRAVLSRAVVVEDVRRWPLRSHAVAFTPTEQRLLSTCCSARKLDGASAMGAKTDRWTQMCVGAVVAVGNTLLSRMACGALWSEYHCDRRPTDRQRPCAHVTTDTCWIRTRRQ